jgi:dTDP-4-dehydrorhamnose 3,5-epimerase
MPSSHLLTSVSVKETPLSDMVILEPRMFEDTRGFFWESYNEREMAEAGIRQRFVQDNHSYSVRNVVRGLHYQVRYPQGKLVRVVVGEILDVAVDLRLSSSTFGKWHMVTLSGRNNHMLWVPPGFAHGFRVLSDEGAHVLYKATDFYHPECERTILWNDPDLNIDWRLDDSPIVSSKDLSGTALRESEKFAGDESWAGKIRANQTGVVPATPAA